MEKDIRMWKVAKPIRRDLGGSKDMAIWIPKGFMDELVESFPNTYLAILSEYRAALNNQCFYKIFEDEVMIVCVGYFSHQICTFEFTCVREGDALFIESVLEGESSAGNWKSVKKEARK